MTQTANPTVTLNIGVEMPMLGLGVFQSPPDETAAAVGVAIADGYRSIDTAAAYGNEREVRVWLSVVNETWPGMSSIHAFRPLNRPRVDVG